MARFVTIMCYRLWTMLDTLSPASPVTTSSLCTRLPCQARSEVRAAFESLTRADAGLASATTAAKLAAEALKLANVAYQAGATTNIEVIDAERRARDAETSAVIAEDGARQARLDLLAASGRFP